MDRRTKKTLVKATVAGLVVAAGLGFVDGLLPEAGAAVTDPVDYEVGGLRVFSTTTRNPSCSITRNLKNEGPVPLFIIGTALWDDQLTDDDPGNNGGVFPQPGDSQFTGPGWLQPGEQTTAVWNGVDRDPPTLSRGAVQVSWSVILQPGVDVGFGRLEFVDPCDDVPGVPPTSPSVPETVPSTTPSTVTPPSSTVPVTVVEPPVSSTTAPPSSVVDDPAPPTTADTGVLTSSIRAELPNTGAGLPVGQLVVLGAALVVTGVSLVVRPGFRPGGRDVSFEKGGK